ALAARAAEPRAPEATAGREVVPGHRFVVARVRAYPAEWLVVYRDGDRVQVVPVDDHPLRGSADEALAEEGLQAESRARCGLADWVGVGVFDDARPTGRIPASLLEAVRLRCAAVAGSRLEPSAVERSVDTSAAYRDLIEMLQRAVSELRTPGSKREPEPPASAQAPTRFEDPSRDRDASSRVGYALAAGLTLAVLGLGLWSAHLAIELDKATQPYVTPAGQAVDVVFGETGRGVELSVGSANPRVVLRLSLARIAVRPSYRLELLSETSQQVIWRSGSVARDAELSLVLPTRLLAPGEYRLRIFAADAEASDAPIAEETLRVRRQPR
ncbi:MAG: hypothetical protein KDD11_21285, partial [Acidobacteria bacterium]|nr:hypothetical protein [Acidobacteriota bacterium]